MGIIYYIFCFGKFPFVGNNQNDLKEKIINDDIDFENGRLSDIKDEDIVLLKKMLDKDYETRINALNAIRHPIFDHLNEEFDDDNMNHYFNEFFSVNTLKLITLYVESSIIKKTFLYMYVLLNPFDKRDYYRKMFLAIDNYFNYIGVLKSREVFEEFKKRKLVDDEAGEIFSFIDCNRTNNAKKLYKKEGSSRGDVSSESSKKELSRTATSKSLKFKDWGQITYTVFLSFFFIDELPKLVDDENKISYLFKFFCDRPLNFDLDKKYSIIDNEGETIYTDGMDHRSNTITKDTFKRFLFKHNLPFKDAEDDINKFFTEHPNPIYYKEFKELILKNESD
jgi:serine/threonine protein kinase